MSNSYLIGAMLDPLVVEFMSPEYCEAMLEAKIRTDEIRGNCPPRAGYVCVLDPRVKTGRYYRKQVAGEGVNALPPSRIEKALAQQEQRSQKGEGISFLGKAAIAGGLAVGGLAAIGAIANSGRSTEPVPDIPNAKKPDTSVKPKTSTYEEARESVRQEVKQKIDPDIPDIPYAKPSSLDDEIEEEIKRVWDDVEKLREEMGMPPSDRSPYAAKPKRGGNPKSADEIQAEIDTALDENDQLKKRSKSSGATAPTSPEAAKRKRGQPTVNDVDTVIQKLEALKQVAKVAAVPSVATVAVGAAAIAQKPDTAPVPLTTTTQVTPNPAVIAAPKAKKKSEPPIDTTTAQGLSHTTIRDGYAAISDVSGKQNIGYKSGGQLRQKLGEGGVIRNGRLTENKADFEALLDNNMLVEKGYLVQTKTGYGGYGKDNISMVRVPAFMPVKDLSSATSNILAEGKGGAGITDRIQRSESLVAAINEKLNKSEDLTDTEREQLAKNRESLNAKIGIDKAKIQKGSAIAETNKPAGQPKPETQKASMSQKAKTPAIAGKPIEDPTTVLLEKPVAATPVRPEPVKPQVKRQKGLGWIDAKDDVAFYDKIANFLENDEKVAKFKGRANTEALDDVAKRLKKMHDEADIGEFSVNKDNAFVEDIKNVYYKIFGKAISTKKQNNDAIASHETYYSAKEQAKRDALRRFAA